MQGEQRIKCLVEECVHNRAFYCTAPYIEVLSCGNRDVHTEDGTRCHSFRRRNPMMVEAGPG